MRLASEYGKPCIVILMLLKTYPEFGHKGKQYEKRNVISWIIFKIVCLNW
jgi:hypothetical protein